MKKVIPGDIRLLDRRGFDFTGLLPSDIKLCRVVDSCYRISLVLLLMLLLLYLMMMMFNYRLIVKRPRRRWHFKGWLFCQHVTSR
jgi:hypothetical protein